MNVKPGVKIIFLSIIFVLLSSSQAFAQGYVIAADPTSVGVGARALGMGKAFVALSDDIQGLFINPAGLGKLSSRLQASSMATRLINEVTYTQLTGAYSTTYGTLAAGFLGTNLATEVTSDYYFDEYGRVIASYEAVQYYNDVFVLSYGYDLKNVAPDNIMFKDTAVGVNTKFFFQGISGISEGTGSATGYEVDVGLLWTPLSWLSLGYCQQNALPVDLGGRIKWESGREEAFPTVSKVGGALKLLGPKGYVKMEQRLTFALDYDFHPFSDWPSLAHVGIEWWPIEYAAVRAGIDQDLLGKGTPGKLEATNNSTYGVTLNYGGYRFDYAYHQFPGGTALATHFFSFSYGFPWKHYKEPAKEKRFIEVISPADKTIVYDRILAVSGKILNDSVKTVLINDSKAQIRNTSFFGNIELGEEPKVKIKIEAKDKNDKVLETINLRILKLKQYADVPKGYWAKRSLDAFATLGLLVGYKDGSFKPDAAIVREELAAVVVRLKGGSRSPAKKLYFKDVTKDHWAVKDIMVAFERGFFKGYPDKTFRPSQKVTRAEAVIALSRFADLEEPEKMLEAPFPDLPGRHWAAKMVTSAKQARLLNFLKGKPFEPDKPMTRAEIVEFISKTKGIKEIIEDLMDFEKGY